jgi:hypothetical protein
MQVKPSKDWTTCNCCPYSEWDYNFHDDERVLYCHPCGQALGWFEGAKFESLDKEFEAPEKCPMTLELYHATANKETKSKV